MNEFQKIENLIPAFWEGKQNVFNRYWTYLQNGLNLITEARYLIISILGGYAVLKLTNPWLMVLMFLISIPILIVAGRWYLYNVKKVQEFVTVTKSSVLGYKPYNVTVETLDELKGLREDIQTLTSKLK